MALFITIPRKGLSFGAKEGDGDDVEWHVGSPSPFKDQFCVNAISVQADGHELEHIIANMPNVPYVKGKRTVKWFGDMAVFIASNL